MSEGEGSTFTGRSRRRRTRWSVRLGDALARGLITVGGIGTIACVLLVCCFLVWVVLPLFGTATIDEDRTIAAPWTAGDSLYFDVDEHRSIGWVLLRDGTLRVFRLDTGETLRESKPFGDEPPTAFAVTPTPKAENETARPDLADRKTVVCGFADGTVALGTLAVKTDFVRSIPGDPLSTLGKDEYAVHEMDDEAGSRIGLVSRTPIGQLRMQSLEFAVRPPFEMANGAVGMIDVVVTRDGPLIAVLTSAAEDDSGASLTLNTVSETTDFFSGDTLYEQGETMPLEIPEDFADRPASLFRILGQGVHLLVGFEDGEVLRYDTRRLDRARLAERIDVVDGDAKLTAADLLIGRETLIVGDSNGAASAWFVVRPGGTTVFSRDVDLTRGELRRFRDGLGLPASVFTTEEAAAIVPADGILLPLDQFTDLVADREIPDEGVVVEADEIELGASGVVIPPAGVETADFAQLVEAHAFAPTSSPVTSIDVSTRSRTAVLGFEDGSARVYQITTATPIVTATVSENSETLTTVAMAPKDDGIYAQSPSGLWTATVDRGHPEITWSSLFDKVWYEGYVEPSHAWQSSGGSQQLEPKFGLMPLVFGSLKATFYSMLFGAPLALLAALYSSEFLQPRTKSRVKPTIEVMAGLPSVVLGFLAALVFAPLVKQFVPATLAAFVTVPLAIQTAAYLQQMLPYRLALAFEQRRFLSVFLVLPLGFYAAYLCGPLVESVFFAGDVILWLDGQRGTGVGAWMFVLLPASLLAMSIASGWWIRPRTLAVSHGWSRETFALAEFVRFVIETFLVFGVAWALSAVLASIGLDPRGSYVDTYVDRNALVVGVVMGFAIIPIIYTIADDALSSVPESLRAASLGAGATPWQTAVRIVIPTAMSGLFSAVMVGLGRAVGETMIVLMAGGNTPVTEWNVFNGFRTLAANIAVELPEAPRDGTHYRTLFFAALTLFALTFVVNTIAELVRLRFRRRVVQL